jgi:hypothetical protein
MPDVNPRQLIQGLEREDPRLWEALNYIFDNVDKINIALFPEEAVFGAEEVTVIPAGPVNLQFAFYPQAIGFSWNFADRALQYEMRVGPSWESGNFVLRTTSLTALIPPKVIGTYHFMIKSLSASGDYSAETTAVDVLVDGPAPVNPSSDVVDNNVLIDWIDSVSEFQIAHYVITRNDVEVGNVLGTFTTLFETLAGTYRYGVIPVDIAGNRGPESQVSAEINQPPDFVLQSSNVSNWAGTKVVCFAYSEGI